jgi:hypothetical protein
MKDNIINDTGLFAICLLATNIESGFLNLASNITESSIRMLLIGTQVIGSSKERESLKGMNSSEE